MYTHVEVTAPSYAAWNVSKVASAVLAVKSDVFFSCVGILLRPAHTSHFASYGRSKIWEKPLRTYPLIVHHDPPPPLRACSLAAAMDILNGPATPHRIR